jgi:SAM-dependent methyltransferase
VGYSNILTKDEYENTAINPEIMRCLESARKQLNLEKNQMNVLDWGCGRGNHVLFLREAGYNAFGVDVSLDSMDRGKDLIRELGYDPNSLLGAIESTGKTLHPDEFFHFLFSYDVLEHVEDIDLVTAELSRLTKSGGFGLHIYPAKWHPIEAHLLMPFVHWLPKNFLRKWAIRTCVTLGIEPHWEELEGLDSAAKTERYLRFSKNATYYRPYRRIVDTFAKYRFTVQSVVMDHPALARFRWIPRGFVEQMVLTFKTVEILTRKE